MKYDLKITVVGSASYLDWAKNVYLACQRMGIPSDIVYTNAFPAAAGGNSDSLVSFFERAKLVVQKYFPFIFPFLKKTRKFLSDIELCLKILIGRRSKKHICIYVWIPGSGWVLKFLKKMNITLVLWQGESTARDASWEPLFDYFDSIFMVYNGIWIDTMREERNRERVQLLPLAADENTFFPLQGAPKTIDVSFVGKYLPSRANVLALIKDCNLKIYGYGWERGFVDHPWLKNVYGGAVPASELNTIYNQSKIAIGTLWLLKEKYTGPTTRIFELALAGTFQIAEDFPLTRQLFGDSMEYFDTGEELKSKIEYYLKHDSEREAKAQQARDVGLKYTYTEAVKKILASCGVPV